MYLRLMVAIFDFRVTLASPLVLPLDLKNYVICRKFSDITLESRHPINIRFDGRHFSFFVGMAHNIVEVETSERMCLCSPTDQ